MVLGLLGSTLPSWSAIKEGSVCKKAQQVRVVKSVSLTCVKSGKKLVWKQSLSSPGVPIVVTPSPSTSPSPSPSPSVDPTPTPTPSPTPSVVQVTIPQGFEDLVENRRGIGYAAWKRISDTMQIAENREFSLDVYVGPKSTPHFNDYKGAVGLLARAFPKRDLPPRTIAILFDYQDIDWAEQTLREKLTSIEFQRITDYERGQFIRGNCETNNQCNGARQQSVPTGLSLIAQGIAPINPYDASAIPRLKTGMLEIHEYFHGMQRVANLNRYLGPNDWPPAWFREGGATWIQNSVVNYKDFDAYEKFQRITCDQECSSMTEADIIEFLTEAKGESIPARYNRWTNYSVGSVVMEALVAIKGQDPMIGMYEEMATGIGFDAAFKKLFGIEWKVAIPILAKAISANNKKP